MVSQGPQEQVRKPACRVPQQEGHILGVEGDREGRVEAGR